jgi:rSAM/selenodomain-associated transferase 2
LKRAADAAPHDAGASTAPSLSIVVPVLNEAELIATFLRHVRARAPEAEIIVADGGSNDATEREAAPLCDRFIRSAPGRSQQLNAGAAAATGDVLWFLHADSELPEGCTSAMAEALRDSGTVGGYFRIQLPATHRIYRLTDSFAHYGGLLLRIRCGDHGFFCRRSVFRETGGFPDVPLMEDVEFYRRLHRFGRVRAVGKRLKTSPRRYEQLGRVRVTLAYGLIATLYAARVPLPWLARLYHSLCGTPPI